MNLKNYSHVVSKLEEVERELKFLQENVMQMIRRRETGRLEEVRVHGDTLAAEARRLRTRRNRYERAIAKDLAKGRDAMRRDIVKKNNVGRR